MHVAGVNEVDDGNVNLPFSHSKQGCCKCQKCNNIEQELQQELQEEVIHLQMESAVKGAICRYCRAHEPQNKQKRTPSYDHQSNEAEAYM